MFSGSYWDGIKEIGVRQQQERSRLEDLVELIKKAKQAIEASASEGLPLDVNLLAIVLADAKVATLTADMSGIFHYADLVMKERDDVVLPVLIQATSIEAKNKGLVIFDHTGSVNQKATIEATGRIPKGSTVELLAFGGWHNQAHHLIIPEWLANAVDAHEVSTLSGMTKMRDSLLIIAAALAKEVGHPIGQRGTYTRIVEAVERYGFTLDVETVKEAFKYLAEAESRRRNRP